MQSDEQVRSEKVQSQVPWNIADTLGLINMLEISPSIKLQRIHRHAPVSWQEAILNEVKGCGPPDQRHQDLHYPPEASRK